MKIAAACNSKSAAFLVIERDFWLTVLWQSPPTKSELKLLNLFQGEHFVKTFYRIFTLRPFLLLRDDGMGGSTLAPFFAAPRSNPASETFQKLESGRHQEGQGPGEGQRPQHVSNHRGQGL